MEAPLVVVKLVLVDRLTCQGGMRLSSDTPYSGHLVTPRSDRPDQDEKRSRICRTFISHSREILS